MCLIINIKHMAPTITFNPKQFLYQPIIIKFSPSSSPIFQSRQSSPKIHLFRSFSGSHLSDFFFFIHKKDPKVQQKIQACLESPYFGTTPPSSRRKETQKIFFDLFRPESYTPISIMAAKYSQFLLNSPNNSLQKKKQNK